MLIDDEQLVRAAAEAAKSVDAGRPIPASVAFLMRAVAADGRDESRRRELALQAEDRAGGMGEAARHVLRVGIFDVP